MQQTFSQKIRETRLALGLTQRELSQRTGLTITYVAGIERGGECGIKAAHSICRALDLGPPWPAVAFMEHYAAKQQRELGIAPSNTYAELAHAVRDGDLVFDADVVDEPAVAE